MLSTSGILYLFTRFGGSKLRQQAFDQKYTDGSWDYFDKDHSLEMRKVVEKYARKGRILDMGCGTGILASMLNPDSFEYYLGVDASREAIALAQKRQSNKINFEISDIQSCKCKERFDLIVFEESLYYVPFFRRRLLQRFAESLRPEGLFIVTVADPNRFGRMIRMIRKKFQIIEDRYFKNSSRLLLVFRN
ncbi:MAG: class I SAM-dependent methyltransferase [Planctomycetota bacterium]|nr:class I SAM-dependent methyltransferase [Planctomycetota bacterium]